MSARIEVEVGKRYNKLTVLEDAGVVKRTGERVYWVRMVRCVCECGNEILTRFSSIRSGITKSCGCLYYGSRSTREPPAVEGARWVALTRNQFCLVDESDYETVSMFRWRYSNGYASTGGGQRSKIKAVQMQRMLMVGSADVGDLVVDHIDRNPLNNRRSNLRLITHAENLANSAPRKGRKYKGVFPKRNRWEAKIMVKMVLHRLGHSFKTAEDAARAYNEAAIRLIGPTAWLNPVEPLTPQ